MARTRQAPGGGRVVEVEPERLRRWFARFAERNDGVVETALGPREVVVTAGDGTTATVSVPFGPLGTDGPDGTDEADGTGRVRDGLAVDPLVDHAQRPRRVGLLLVRLGAHSVGVAENGHVTVSRTDRHLVQGRSAAGGWSQQRFARR
ncbi:acVLRF1 family peptidyl-tRNA hydrolase, partial [Saccharomonospora iraqiensis]|uniref:acVLRF1 family peptidyl-tRNA hydrolase n=1 Tax=Saccharomonospora iraqiensis TaxID=52698 RepID=UPI00055214EA